MSFSCVAKGCKTGLYIDAFMNIFKYIIWEEDALSAEGDSTLFNLHFYIGKSCQYLVKSIEIFNEKTLILLSFIIKIIIKLNLQIIFKVIN